MVFATLHWPDHGVAACHRMGLRLARDVLRNGQGRGVRLLTHVAGAEHGSDGQHACLQCTVVVFPAGIWFLARALGKLAVIASIAEHVQLVDEPLNQLADSIGKVFDTAYIPLPPTALVQYWEQNLQHPDAAIDVYFIFIGRAVGVAAELRLAYYKALAAANQSFRAGGFVGEPVMGPLQRTIGQIVTLYAAAVYKLRAAQVLYLDLFPNDITGQPVLGKPAFILGQPTAVLRAKPPRFTYAAYSAAVHLPAAEVQDRVDRAVAAIAATLALPAAPLTVMVGNQVDEQHFPAELEHWLQAELLGDNAPKAASVGNSSASDSEDADSMPGLDSDTSSELVSEPSEVVDSDGTMPPLVTPSSSDSEDV